MRSVHSAPNAIAQLTVIRDGQQVVVGRDPMAVTRQKGGSSLGELRPGLLKFIKDSEDLRHLVATDFEKATNEVEFNLLFTTPCNPRFQPIELYWRDSKILVYVNGDTSGNQRRL